MEKSLKNKNKGKIFIILIYIIFIFQLWIVIISRDTKQSEKNTSYILYHKIYYYFLLFMTIWSHIKSSITNPGKITPINNRSILEFYLNIHDKAIKRAEKYNNNENLLKKISKINENINEYDGYSDIDEEKYEPITSITDDYMNKISENYKIKLTRCFQCFVVRPPRCHHCAMCASCVTRMDYHCPWTNNCIGQFTQKFIILFCFYGLIGNIEALIIEFYYEYYKSKNLFIGKIKNIFILIQLIFNILFIIIFYGMLSDQFIRIKCDTFRINIKNKKFEEKRKLNEVIKEIFGCKFSISWFIPIKIGGYKPFFDKIDKGIKRM